MKIVYQPASIQKLRRERGLGVEELAEKAHMSDRQLYNLERGISIPKADTLGELAGALGVTVEAFFARRAA